jgi:hypothetical protein
MRNSDRQSKNLEKKYKRKKKGSVPKLELGPFFLAKLYASFSRSDKGAPISSAN